MRKLSVIMAYFQCGTVSEKSEGLISNVYSNESTTKLSDVIEGPVYALSVTDNSNIIDRHGLAYRQLASSEQTDYCRAVRRQGTEKQ